MPVAEVGVEPSQRESIIKRIMADAGFPFEKATRCFEETLKFLDVTQQVSRCSPSRTIDEGWHAFILHTPEYTRYCQERFGRYVHHQPMEGGDPQNYLRARAMAEELFGTLDERFWPQKAGKITACSDPDGECSGQCGPENNAADCHDDGHCGEVSPTMVKAGVGADCHGDGHCGSASCADST